ncbi:MAG: hydrogenase maturation nickel metallochaperone HypA [Desulfuromonas sp.]|nr:MAG: hydrogenase maturation nickel metallochaperone HypA [Desulfuromonas sp.]
MHELGITRSIVEIAEENARRQGAQRVLSVTIEIGDLAGVIPDSVAFCYEVCCEGTLLAGSELLIRQVKGKGRCRDCGADIDLDTTTFNCSTCGSYALERLQGEELRVIEMEIE